MQLESHEINCPKAIILLQRMLQLAGIWPTKQFSNTKMLKLFLNWILLFVAIIGMGIELYNVTDDINKIIEVLVSLLQFIIVTVKFVSVIVKKECFIQLLKQLRIIASSTNANCAERPIKRAIVVCNRVVTFFGVLTIFVVIFYTFFPILDKKGLPIPLGYNLGNYYYLIHFLECLMLIIAGLTGNSVDALYVTLVVFAAAEIEILNEKLLVCAFEAGQHIKSHHKDDTFDVCVRRNLLRCIKMYTAVIRFVHNIDNMFSFAILVQYVLDMVHVCSLLVQLMFLIEPYSSQFILAILFLMAVLTQLSFYHWFGNEIISKSSRIEESLYMSTWYDCGISNRRIIIIFLERAKRHLAVTVYKFTNVSLASFAIIIRWAYSLFTLLESTLNKKIT